MFTFRNRILWKGLAPVFAGLICLITACRQTNDRPAPPDSPPATGDRSGTAGEELIADSIGKRLEDHSAPSGEVLLPESVEELIREMAHQTSRLQNETDPAALRKTLDTRHKAAEKLLRFELTEEQQYLAVRTRLDSLIRLKMLGDQNAAATFGTWLESLHKDPHPRVREMAGAAEVVSEVNERLAKKDQNLDSVLGNFARVASSFPESVAVRTELFQCADLVLQSGLKDTGLRMLEILVETAPATPAPEAIPLLDHIRNRIELVRLNVDAALQKLRNQDESALAELETALQGLLQSESFHLENLMQINARIDWMERNQQTGSAAIVNRYLQNASNGIRDPLLKTRAEEWCELRSTRIGLAGSKLPDHLLLADGTVLDPGNLLGRNTLVVVWSPSEPLSIDLIKQVDGLYRQQGERPWNLLGVCLTRKAEVVRTLFGGEFPAWPCAVPSPDPLALAARFGTSSTPHILMLDAQGRFTATNIAPSAIEQQLGARNR